MTTLLYKFSGMGEPSKEIHHFQRCSIHTMNLHFSETTSLLSTLITRPLCVMTQQPPICAGKIPRRLKGMELIEQTHKLVHSCKTNTCTYKYGHMCKFQTNQPGIPHASPPNEHPRHARQEQMDWSANATNTQSKMNICCVLQKNGSI